MPTDPVYNPHLPSSSSSWTPSSSVMADESSRSGSVASSSMLEETPAQWSTLSAVFVAGAIAGAGLALMLAPARGSDVRRSIRQYASNGTHRIVEGGRSMAGGAAQRASSFVEQGRRAFRTSSSARATGSRQATGSTSMGPGANNSAAPPPSGAGSQPLTASVAEISGVDRRFEEPLGG